MPYAAKREKESPCFVLVIQEGEGEPECRREGELGGKSPSFGIACSCEAVGKMQEIRKD